MSASAATACRSRSARSRISAATRSCAPASRAARSRSIVGEDEEIPAEPKVTLRSGRHQHLRRFLARRDGGLSMDKTWNNKAWFLVLPVLVLVAFSAVIPLMTVVNYSVQDTFGNNEFFWAGTEWFEEMLHSDRFWEALGRNLIFSVHHPGDRGSARHLHRAQHAEEGLGRAGLPGADGAAAADPVERRRHDLAGVRPHRHRPARLYAQRARHRLQLRAAIRSTPG